MSLLAAAASAQRWCTEVTYLIPPFVISLSKISLSDQCLLEILIINKQIILFLYLSQSEPKKIVTPQ